MNIPYELKSACVKMRDAGKPTREIYTEYFSKQHTGMSLETFRRKLRMWRKKQMADEATLHSGTYGGFTAHNATVQVNAAGDIVQAWIKQRTDFGYEELLETIRDSETPVSVAPKPWSEAHGMLEIPLFDMHFGVAKLEDYMDALQEILGVIDRQHWKEINIIVGQDLLHNNDMRGHTAKGTSIERVDIASAWRDARCFWSNVIEAALENACCVRLHYSKGNHDECISWCFVQMLKERYPYLEVDDSLRPRKAILWDGCFIGFGHCEYTNRTQDLFRDFVMDYPAEFAAASVREIHAGHLHRESADNGVMVRRLASAVPVDEWSNNNGYASAHKRFQIFEWSTGRLKAIYYI